MWGRMLSVLFSLFTIYGLFLLVRKFLSENAALWTAFIYTILPLNIFYARAFMPESALLMCTVWGVYWFSQWIDRERPADFIRAVLFIALAALIKIPTLYIGLPLLYLAWARHGSGLFRKPVMWIFALLVFAPIAGWYYHAHQVYQQFGLTFGIWGFGTDKWGNFDLLTSFSFYNDVFFKSIAERHFTFIGFILFLTGLFFTRKSPGERVFDFWLIGVVVYILIVAEGNRMHEYYQLPFILPGVVFIGKVLDRYVKPDVIGSFRKSPVVVSLLGICMLAIFVLSYIRYDALTARETHDNSLFRLAEAVERHTNKDDLVIAVSEGNPIVLYRCGRRGWNGYVWSMDTAWLESKRDKGARYLVGQKKFFDGNETTLENFYTHFVVVEKGEDYFIIEL